MSKPQLELHLVVAAGREADCAAHLRARVAGEHWAILAALAAEVVSIHERETHGRAIVVIAGPAAADRVAEDLLRSGKCP